jgi:hypothetical protein
MPGSISEWDALFFLVYENYSVRNMVHHFLGSGDHRAIP